MSNQDKVRIYLSEYIETEMVEVTNPGKRRNAACACKETVDDKCRESSRGSCSPSKRPLLGGECPSNYISRM
eukprot:Em0001g2892a